MHVPVIFAFLFVTLAAGCQSGEKPPVVQESRDKALTAKTPTSVSETANSKASPTPETAEPPPPQQELKKPPRRRYVVAALGDSLTDARSGGGYLKVLAARCPQSRFENFGKGADMTNQMRRRFESDIVPQIDALSLTTLIVYGGVNDLYSDLTAGRTNIRIEEELSAIYASAKDNGLEVVALTVSPWGGFSRYFNERRGQNTRLLNSWILGQVSRGKITQAVDTFPLLSCGSPDILCADYETRSHDGIHLGPQGHTLLGEKLFDVAFADCL